MCNEALGVPPEQYIRHLVQHARTVRECAPARIQKNEDYPYTEGETEG